jgi:Conserved region of Rad21 / Rec8 like protein
VAKGGSNKRARDDDVWVPLTQLMEARSREDAAKTFYDALVLQAKSLARILQNTGFEELQLQLVAAE